MFFIVSVINNYALNFNIAMPLHMIFRAGSLLASMILGILILKRRYTAMKYLSVLMISAGIFIFLIVSAKDLVRPIFINFTYIKLDRPLVNNFF